MHSLMSVFQGRIQMVERENNPVAEVLENFEDCTVFLCCYIPQCQCRESLFTDAKSVD